MRLRSSLLAAVVLALCAAPSSAGPQPPAGWTDGYVMANGIRIHYWRTGGNKPALVMAHGSSDDGLCWTNLAREFQDQYDIVMFDARGHGLSDPPTPSDPPDVQVEDLAGLIKELKLESSDPDGTFDGQLVGRRGSPRSIRTCARAVILEDPGLVRPGHARGRRGARRRRSSGARHILARNNTTEEELVAGCMKNSPKWGRSECEFWAPSKRRHHPGTVQNVPSTLPPVGELFAKITAPTLILKADAQGDLEKAERGHRQPCCRKARSCTSKGPGTTSAARTRRRRSR